MLITWPLINSNTMEVKKPFRLADNTALCLSPDFILPEEKRPCLSNVSPMHSSVPIIDMKGYDSCHDDGLVQNVSQACQQVGMFQLINHGIQSDLCRDVLVALLEFFQLPSEERAKFFTKDQSLPLKVFSYYYKDDDDDQNKVKMWSETLSHPWHPTQDFTHHLPSNPPQYRDVFAAYAREIGKLMKRLLGLMSKGLGLEEDSLVRRVGERPSLYTHANYYPPCPEPELTMGLKEHNDITALTILLQLDGIAGLQVNHEGNWVPVDPIPGALVIILADQMQVLSNGRYRSPVHRAVTNKGFPRLSLAMFHAPNDDTVIGPMEELTDEQHPPIYRSYRYKEFMDEFQRQEGKMRRVKEAFQL